MKAEDLETRPSFNWKLFLMVWAISIISWFLVLPFTIVMIGDALSEMGSLSSFVLSTLISNLVILGATALLGLFAARKIGLGLPLVAGWLNKNFHRGVLIRTLRIALLTGFLTGVLLILIDVVIFTPYLESAIGVSNANILNPDLDRASPWYGFMAAISAGVTEEVIFRLFGVSVIAWLGGLIFKYAIGRPKPFVFWFAILVMSFIFGLAHLQTPALVGWELSSAAVIRALALNAIGGLVYGWMYWRHGLESAIVTHFSTDLVLHVIVPMIFLFVN